MVESFHGLEESLKAFLAEAQSDRHNNRNTNFYKYNNLKISIDPKKNQNPHFIIRIGISESMYNAQNGEIISGGLGSDERYVRRWIEKNLQRLNAGVSWKDVYKVKPLNGTDDDDAFA